MPWMVAVGRRQAAHPLDRAALKVLDDASRNACDALDGLTDGVINDPRNCTMDLDSLLCADGGDRRLPAPGTARKPPVSSMKT